MDYVFTIYLVLNKILYVFFDSGLLFGFYSAWLYVGPQFLKNVF